MKRALLLVAVACSHQHSLQIDASSSEHDQLAANVSMRADSEEHVQLDKHRIDTAGPGERVDRVFAPLPDGGVYLAHETQTRWGGSTTENWLKSALNAQEHIEIDAGVVQTHEAASDLHEREKDKTTPAASCGASGVLWAIAAILGAILVFIRWRRAAG